MEINIPDDIRYRINQSVVINIQYCVTKVAISISVMHTPNTKLKNKQTNSKIVDIVVNIPIMGLWNLPGDGNLTQILFQTAIYYNIMWICVMYGDRFNTIQPQT